MQPILVVGATGNVGRALTELLIERETPVHAACRHPERSPIGSTGVYLDLEQPVTFRPALQGIERIFLIGPPGHPEPQGLLVPLLDVAQKNGVRRVVLMTAMGVDQNESLGLRQVEKALMSSGLEWTILRPNWFMQNFSTGFIGQGIRGQGSISIPAADAAVSYIDCRDIAAVAAAALVDDGHQGRAYTLTGGRASDLHEVARLISVSAGCVVPYIPVSEDMARQGMLAAGRPSSAVEFMLGLFAAMRRGYNAPLSPDVQRVLGRPPRTLESFVAEHVGAWCVPAAA